VLHGFADRAKMQGMRLPRFSLRMLFLLVALISIPVAWTTFQLNWLRKRHEFISQFHAHSLNDEELKDSRSHRTLWLIPDDSPPWTLRLLGETRCPTLLIPRTELRRLTELFPEFWLVPGSSLVPGDLD
jgi:hypothetical protein